MLRVLRSPPGPSNLLTPADFVATFLDLPNELLLRIAQLSAPLGGKAAANLNIRLTCHRLGCAAESVTWSSIRLPTNAKSLEQLLAYLIQASDKSRALVRSVTYPLTDDSSVIVAAVLSTLPSLLRLRVTGRHKPLSVPLYRGMVSFPTLRIFILEEVVLTNRCRLKGWPALTNLSLRRCTTPLDIFREESGDRCECSKLNYFELETEKSRDPPSSPHSTRSRSQCTCIRKPITRCTSILLGELRTSATQLMC